MTKDENRRLLEDTLAAAKTVEALERSRAASVGNGGAANININAGGVGVYVAVCACLMTLTGLVIACVFAVSVFTEQNAQIREMRMRYAEIQAYINAGLVQPPKEEESK